MLAVACLLLATLAAGSAVAVVGAGRIQLAAAVTAALSWRPGRGVAVAAVCELGVDKFAEQSVDLDAHEPLELSPVLLDGGSDALLECRECRGLGHDASLRPS